MIVNLTQQEREALVQILDSISNRLNQAPFVLQILDKLRNAKETEK